MMFTQTIKVTQLNLANIKHRLGASAVLVVGIAGVVAVLLGILAMSNGLTETLVNTTYPDRGLILRNGSNSEMDGWITNEELAVIQTHAGFRQLSPELYVTMSVALDQVGNQADAVARGVTGAAFSLRDEIQIVRGRTLVPGKSELLVGVGAAREFANLEVGSQVAARNTTFTVVGHFQAAGGSAESELWMDLAVAQNTFRRTGANVIRTALTDPSQAQAINTALQNDRRITATLIMESDFFAKLASARTGLINTFAYLIASIMAAGAVVAALNTMYTIVGKRTLEIATLRALGFKPAAVITSVVFEAMLLALIGATLGTVIAYLGFDGLTSTTQNGAGSQTAFAFTINTPMILQSTGLALALGWLGSILPALRSTRLPISTALRRA